MKKLSNMTPISNLWPKYKTIERSQCPKSGNNVTTSHSSLVSILWVTVPDCPTSITFKMLWPLVTMNYGSQALNSFSVTSRILCCCPAAAAAAAAAATVAADNF